MENMQIYNAGRAVPPEARKQFSNGSFSGTDINPMWRIKKLTELFGACGVGWYIETLKRETLAVDDDLFAIVDINLFIKVDGEWSKPIFGTGGNKLRSKTKTGARTSDEGFKMAYTDAISVACKALGIGADVYFEKDKSSKYSEFYTDAAQDVPRASETPNTPPTPADAAIPSKERKMATQAQRNVILGLPEDNELRTKAIAAFGDGLERLSAYQAVQLINRVKGQPS